MNKKERRKAFKELGFDVVLENKKRLVFFKKERDFYVVPETGLKKNLVRVVEEIHFYLDDPSWAHFIVSPTSYERTISRVSKEIHLLIDSEFRNILEQAERTR